MGNRVAWYTTLGRGRWYPTHAELRPRGAVRDGVDADPDGSRAQRRAAKKLGMISRDAAANAASDGETRDDTSDEDAAS